MRGPQSPPPRLRSRLPQWTRRINRKRVLQGAAAFVLVLFIIALVPPFRRAALLAVSKVILTVASPLAPSIGNFKALPEPSRILGTDGSELARLDGGVNRQQVRLQDLPPQVPHAVLAAEDANFYHHGGVDPQAVGRALLHTAEGRTQGGSTITQQLAKINYTNSQRTVFRKLRELEYAVRLEKKYSKNQLLERYLNQVYFGDGAYGIAAASQTFFGVPPEQLTPAEAALLAGKIRSPEGLDPRKNPAPVQHRRDQVLRNMKKHGWLSKADYDQAVATQIELAPDQSNATAAKAPHFVEYVKREAAGIDVLGGSADARSTQLFTGGYTIETTLDPKLFDEAETAVKTNLGGPNDPATAIVTVQPGDGAIRMLFGGLNFDRKFDLASQGRRQPGSSFKPFVYLAAVGQGISPRSTFVADSPQILNYKGSTFTVNNYEGEGHGQSDVDNAMAHSINVVFSQLALQAGLDNVVHAAESAGIPTSIIDRDKNNPAIALGGLTKGISPLEQAAAYATFAAKGTYAEPYSIVRIKDRNGKVIYTHSPKTRQAFDPKEVGVLNNALMGVVDHGTGTAADIGRPQAGKTGTTQNYGDAWFVGYMPQLATAVWVGYPDRVAPMTSVHGIKVAGGTFPARMWASYMSQAIAGLPPTPLPTNTPEELGLKPLTPPPPPTLPTSSTTSSSTTTSSSSTTSSTTTSLPATTTTTGPKKTTTTTTTSSTTSSTTSTTVAAKSATTTTTTP